MLTSSLKLTKPQSGSNNKDFSISYFESHWRFNIVSFDVPPRYKKFLWYAIWFTLPDKDIVFHKSRRTDTNKSFKSEDIIAKQWYFSMYVNVKHDAI